MKPPRAGSCREACPMPPAAPVITATCPLIVCILAAPPDGASRARQLFVCVNARLLDGSRIIEFIESSYKFPCPVVSPFFAFALAFVAIALRVGKAPGSRFLPLDWSQVGRRTAAPRAHRTLSLLRHGDKPAPDALRRLLALTMSRIAKPSDHFPRKTGFRFSKNERIPSW
jgi:hypothetical protein